MSKNLFGLTDQELVWLQTGKLDQLSDETITRLERDYSEEFADFAAMAPMLTRHAHLTGDEINAYLNADPFAEELSSVHKVAIEAHIRQCGVCREAVEVSRAFFLEPEPAPASTSYLAPIFLEFSTNYDRPSMRGGGTSYRGKEYRRDNIVTLRGNIPDPVVFEKDDISVFLELEVHKQVSILRGQLLADIELDDEIGGTVEIWQAQTAIDSVPLDEIGMFVAEIQISGIFNIRIIIDGYPEIIIEHIAIEETG